MNWNKFELYDDNYPWSIKSENGRWVIVRDCSENISIFYVEDGGRKIMKKFIFANTTPSPLRVAKDFCASKTIETIDEA